MSAFSFTGFAIYLGIVLVLPLIAAGYYTATAILALLKAKPSKGYIKYRTDDDD